MQRSYGSHQGESKGDRGTRWLFTLNNYTDDDYAVFADAPDRAYCIIGREIGPECGTPHFQGYITFGTKQKRFAWLKELHPRASWRKANGSTEQNIDYCSKDDHEAIEFGERPKVGRRGKFIDAVDMIVAGESITDVAIDNPESFARGGRGLRDLRFALQEAYTHHECRGEWYVGPPGTGKTHKARTEHPNAFIKHQNKWWDGYDGEEVVILDDMDDPCLKHYCKLWADKWSCKGETKGGYTQLVHKKFIVTSNYTIDELFKESGDDMVAAIKRRFKVTVFRDHPFNGCPVRPTDPVARGLWAQAGILEDDESAGTQLTTGLWDFGSTLGADFE